MIKEILLAIVQSATEFLPVSSSGHLALIAHFISKPDLFFFTALHLSSLIAILIFVRKEIIGLFSLKKEYIRLWAYLAIATLPAAVFGFLFNERIEEAFFSFRFIGMAYIFTGVVLYITRFSKERRDLNLGMCFAIGIFQILALFPGVSRSGITISSALLLGAKREEAAKFSFLLFIPLSLGAFALEAGKGGYFDAAILTSSITCALLSLVFLSILLIVVKKGTFWIFSIYCFIIGIFSLLAG